MSNEPVYKRMKLTEEDRGEPWSDEDEDNDVPISVAVDNNDSPMTSEDKRGLLMQYIDIFKVHMNDSIADMNDISKDNAKEIIRRYEASKQYGRRLNSRAEAAFNKAKKILANDVYKVGEMYVCCNEEEMNFIIEMADVLKTIAPYSSLLYHDIYFVLIYTLYSLRNEQTEDWLTFDFFKDNVFEDDLPLTKKLYFDISSGNIMAGDRDISSEIRKKFMEMNGGKIHKKRYKKRTNKRKTMRRKGNKKRTNKKRR